MEDGSETGLDIEYRRYLHILRPYLVQIVDEKLAGICNSWLRRLTASTAEEKPVRNQYIFAMCYQLSQGMLDEPFLQPPPSGKLLPICSDDNQSDESLSEIECVVINNDEPKTKILFGRQTLPPSTLTTRSTTSKDEYNDSMYFNDNSPRPRKNDDKFLNTCPDEIKKYISGDAADVIGSRANNLIMKLREMKLQNLQLFNELKTLKQEARCQAGETSVKNETIKVDETTSACLNIGESSTTLKSLKFALQEAQQTRTLLIQKIESQQEEIDNFDDMKRHEIEDLTAKHKMEIINIKTSIREECNNNYKKIIGELKLQYDDKIKDLEQQQMTNIKEQIDSKDQLIKSLQQDLKAKDNEIANLKQQLEYEKEHIRTVMTKYFETSHSSGDNNIETLKFKAETLQEQLSKLEKAKLKNAKYYETKLSCFQREKQLSETTYQLQLIRQRTQIVNEFADENQTEVTAAIEKLEDKYKAIVANTQATAIQRRMQDQKTIEVILQTLRGDSNFGSINFEDRNKSKNTERKNGDEFASFVRSCDDDNFVHGYCLDSGKMGQLIDKIYIPQKDTGNPSNK